MPCSRADYYFHNDIVNSLQNNLFVLSSPAMKTRQLVYALLITMLMACGLISCQQTSPFQHIPRNGFITHFEESDGSRMPFASYWDISDNEDWNERVQGFHYKSQPVYVKPISLEFFTPGDTLHANSPEVVQLRDYFQQKLTAELKRQDASDNNFHLVSAPTKDAYTVEIALLSASPTRIMNNAAATAAGVVVKGGSFLVSRAKDKGTLSMGIRFYDPSGNLVAETADFEYGMQSIPGMILVDSKDFRPFAYHKRIIDEWVKEISTIFITVHEHRIKRPWYSLNPF